TELCAGIFATGGLVRREGRYGSQPAIYRSSGQHCEQVPELQAERTIRGHFIGPSHWIDLAMAKWTVFHFWRTAISSARRGRCAPGAGYANRACGPFGAAGCCSFFGNKNMTTTEGGMITTSDPALARRLRSMRSHGMTVSSWDRDKGRPSQNDVLE